MDYYLLADMTVQIGYELAVAGAETYRVEETMRRVIEAYGTEGQAFAIPNCVAVSFVTPNTKPLTIMKRVGYHGNDLERIEKLNALSRRICAEVPEPQEAQRWLKETTAAVRSYAVWIYYLGNFMAAAGFCCVFGGTVRDWLWAGLSGLIIGFVTRCMDRLEVNPFFSTIAASFFMALPAYLAAGLGWLEFVILFNVHDWGSVLCALGSALTWIVYLLCSRAGFSIYSANFFSEVVAAVYSEGMGRWRKCPVTSYLVISSIPLLPGAGIYYTMSIGLSGSVQAALQKGLETAGIAGSLAVGILLVSTVFRAVNARRRRASAPGRE